MNLKPKHLFLAIVTTALISCIITASLVLSTTTTSTFYISGGIYPGAPAYTVWSETDGNYYAKDANGLLSTNSNATTLIQTCINSAIFGQVVYFAKGIYLIDAPLSLKNGTCLIGEGVGFTIIRQTNLTANTINAECVWAITVKDLTLDKSANFALGGDAIYLYNVSAFMWRAEVPPNASQWLGYGAHLSNLLILNQINGIHIVNSKWVYIEDTQIFNIGSPTIEGTGIIIDRDTDFYLNRIWLAHHYIYNGTYPEISTNATGIGIKILGGGGFYFTDVQVVGKYWKIGFELKAEVGAKIWWCFFNHVIADTCGGNGFQLTADATSEIKGIQFVDCWSSSNSDNGFYFYGLGTGNFSVYGMSFTGCRAVSNGGNGFLFSQNVGDINIAESQISDNNVNASAITGDGVQFANVSGAVSIHNNRIGNFLWQSNKQRYGVYIGAYCDNYSIIENDLFGNLNAALYDNSHGVNGTIKTNHGFVTENNGMVVNATATTFTITHGLAGTPDWVWCSFNSTQIDGWAWTATSTTITVTVHNRVVSDQIVACYWKGEYVP